MQEAEGDSFTMFTYKTFLGFQKVNETEKNFRITPRVERSPVDCLQALIKSPQLKHSSCPFTLTFKLGIINTVFTDEEN